jgi:methylase of polypeptide subunit release factors
VSWLRDLIFRCVRTATRSRLLARALFRIDFRPLQEDETYFDVTTPVLVRQARRRLTRSSKVLDLGTGTVAVVGLALWRRLGCAVTSADVNPESVRLAQANVDRNRAPIRVIHSNFFDAIDDDFDAVVFNPPYVPTEAGRRRGLSPRWRRQWDGGPDGLAVIEAFVRALETDRRDPLVLMGVNHRHTPREPLSTLLDRHPGVETEDVYRHPLLPVDVYVLRKRGALVAARAASSSPCAPALTA